MKRILIITAMFILQTNLLHAAATQKPTGASSLQFLIIKPAVMEFIRQQSDKKYVGSYGQTFNIDFKKSLIDALKTPDQLMQFLAEKGFPAHLISGTFPDIAQTINRYMERHEMPDWLKAYVKEVSIKDKLEQGKMPPVNLYQWYRENNEIFFDMTCTSCEDIQSLEGLLLIPNIEKVTQLSFLGLPIERIPRNTFTGLSEITYLDLRGSHLRSIDEGAFNGLHALKRVVIANDLAQPVKDRIIEEIKKVSPDAKIEED